MRIPNIRDVSMSASYALWTFRDGMFRIAGYQGNECPGPPLRHKVIIPSFLMVLVQSIVENLIRIVHFCFKNVVQMQFSRFHDLCERNRESCTTVTISAIAILGMPVVKS